MNESLTAIVREVLDFEGWKYQLVNEDIICWICKIKN